MFKVYCIVITYNGREWIEKCLTSLTRQKNGQLHIICIDNGSTDDTVAFTRSNFPAVEIIQTNENLGFGQANNIGFKKAVDEHADYVFLLNQDAWIEPGTIEKLINIQQENPRYGLISPVHLNARGEKFDLYFQKYMDETGVDDFAKYSILARTCKEPLLNTAFVNAAAWLLSIECIKKTGGFDPIFFHYGEDKNYCQRVMYHGFSIGIHTGSFIYHDREMRLYKEKKDVHFKLKNEWHHFLNQACDINKSSWMLLCIKRSVRYAFLSFTNLIVLRKDAVIYNFGMGSRIIISLGRIARSRKYGLTTFFKTTNI